MPSISFWTIFVLFGIVSRWAQKALEDGKITLTEAAELAEDLGPVLGIPVEIQVPAPPILSHDRVALGDDVAEQLETDEEESTAERSRPV